jgi:hypothetical protein
MRQLGKELGRRIVLLLFRKRAWVISFDESERSNSGSRVAKDCRGMPTCRI